MGNRSLEGGQPKKKTHGEPKKNKTGCPKDKLVTKISVEDCFESEELLNNFQSMLR